MSYENWLDVPKCSLLSHASAELRIESNRRRNKALTKYMNIDVNYYEWMADDLLSVHTYNCNWN